MEIKKSLILFLLLFTCIVPLSMAQGGGDDKHEKIEAARVAHITSRLNLSPEQAQKFWPLYNEFSAKRENLRKQHRQVFHEARDESFSNEQAKRAINNHVRMEKEEAALDEEYYGNKLQTILEPRQIMKLMQAEHEFRKMLLERLKDKRPN
jgi:Spy/CpxP family protein refolding chaperone